MDRVFKVTELFTSIEGEGVRSGELAFFLRLFGCNLDCTYCDSRFSHEAGSPHTEMTLEEILASASASGCENVTVTGGEPLAHEGINELFDALCSQGHRVNVETNGSKDISAITRREGLFFTADYKCPCSGMTDKMLMSNLKSLQSRDVLKFVVADKADLEEMLRVIRENAPRCLVYISPVFGTIAPGEIVEFMKVHKLTRGIRLQLQLHKYVYPPDMRGV